MPVCSTPFDHIIEAAAAISKATHHLDRASKSLPAELLEKLESIPGQSAIEPALVKQLQDFAMALPDDDEHSDRRAA